VRSFEKHALLLSRQTCLPTPPKAREKLDDFSFAFFGAVTNADVQLYGAKITNP
jgi:hypothetical protein